MSLFDVIKKIFGFGNPEAEVSDWTAELNREAEDDDWGDLLL